MKSTVFYIIVVVGGCLIALSLQPLKTEDILLQTSPISILPPHTHNTNDDTIIDLGHGIEKYSEIYVSQKDLWITSIDLELINASSSVLHHVVLANASSSPVWCSDEADERYYYLFAEDQMHDRKVQFPTGYALYIPRNTPLVLDGLFHNAQPPIGTGDTYRNVSARIVLHTQEPSRIRPLKRLTFYAPHLSDDQCAPRDASFFFSIPSNTSNYLITGEGKKLRPDRIVFNTPVTIKYWFGHLHGWQGGKELIVKKNGELLRVFRTQRSEVESYQFDTPHGATNIHLAAGDTLSLEALYDNPTKELTIGAMGVLYLLVAEE